MSELHIGSIWRQRDGRFSRYVRVVSIGGGTITRVGIQTVSCDDGRAITGRTTYANGLAFGKRYDFVRATSSSVTQP